MERVCVVFIPHHRGGHCFYQVSENERGGAVEMDNMSTWGIVNSYGRFPSARQDLGLHREETLMRVLVLFCIAVTAKSRGCSATFVFAH